MSVTGDLLTAAGLLLATLGLLFSAWYPEIAAATDVSTRGKRADRNSRIEQVGQALFARALPLLVAVILIAIACAPPAANVVVRALTTDWGNSYDPVRAMFVGVWLLNIGLVAALIEQVRKLSSKRRALKQPDAPDASDPTAVP